jgi:DNA gyrase subunit B
LPEKTNTAAPKKGGSESYGAKDITVLEGLEAVRKRPGMYIGSTGPRGLHHLVYEVLDNSVDEAIAGYCDSVRVVLHPDNSCTVIDNGRGIPVDELKKEKRPAAEVVLTTLHAGGKFGGDGYKVSGGLHGVGISVVNALSEQLHLEISRDGAVWTQDYERGKPQADLHRGEASDAHGTTITFLPDDEIFDELEFDYATLAERLRETAFLTRGLKIELVDERAAGQKDTFHYEGGIVDFVAHLNENKDPLHRKTVFFENETDDGQVEVAMQWNSSYQESIFSFANNINTHEGGSHLSGFRSALTRTLNAYARGKGLLKEKDENLTAVRGSDQDQARQPADRGTGQGVGQPQARRVLRGEPGRGETNHRQGSGRRPRPPGGTQGTRSHPTQVGAGELDPAGQARRLHGPRPSSCRAVHRRG